jgi:hypothetical protein
LKKALRIGVVVGYLSINLPVQQPYFLMMHLFLFLQRLSVSTMKKLFFLLFINIFYVGQSQILGQSGWTRNKGGVYAKLGFYTLKGAKYFDTEGVKIANKTFHQQAMTLYGEYGINKNITAILNFPVVKKQFYSNYSAVTGLGNPQIEIKMSVLRKIPVIALSIGAELPIAKQANYSVAKTADNLGIFDKINLPTGYPDLNYWGTLAVSSGFWQGLGWGTFYGQYIFRGKDINNQAKFGIEMGYKWTPQFWTNARLVGWYKASSKTSNVNASFINGQSTQYTSLGIGAAYEIVKHWSLTADFQSVNNILVRPKNTQDAPFFQLGISAEF